MAEGTPPGEPAVVHWSPPGRPVRTWEVSGVAVRDRSGTIVATECVARDISVRVAAQEALERSEGRFREMLTNLQLLAIIVDADGRCVFANAAAARLAGSTPDALVGQDLVHLLAPAAFATQARAYLAMLLAGMPSDRRDLVIRAADGTDHTLVWDPIVLHDDAGKASAVAAIGEDVTEARQAAADRDRLMAVTERSTDAVAIVDADGSIGYANAAMLARLGTSREATIGRPAHEILPARLGIPWPMPEAESEGIWRAERRAPGGDADAPAVVEELMVSPIVTEDGTISHHVVEAWDVSRVRELEWAVDHAARASAVVFAALHHLDAGSTTEATAEAIVRELRGLPGVDAAAILAFDLPAGGHVLAAGGIDGMTVGAEAPPDAVAYLRDQLAGGPFTERWTERHPHSRLAADGRQVIGVAVGPLLSDGRLVGLVMLASADPDEARRFAGDLSTVAELSAMVSVLLGPAIREQQSAAATRHQLGRVIDEARFEVRYQPVVDLESMAVVGYEATTRFLDPLEPTATLEAAAAVGLAAPLETAMLRAATERAADLPPTAWLGLNLTPALLAGLDSLADLLRHAGRPVVLELSEHLLIGEYAPLRASLQALGPEVRLAIDDTGAGQANLAHLVELSAAFVKLDVSLVRGVDTDVTRQAMARGILQFAAATGSTVIAEGVETDAELATLRRLGVTMAQGHLLGRPAPAATWAGGGRGVTPA
jgi:PAS domain S-box-containing protein